MKRQYTIDGNDRQPYPLGATATAEGMHFSFVDDGGSCRLLLFEQGKKEPLAEIGFPPKLKMGSVWSMTLKGDFQGIEYLYEADGVRKEDPWALAYGGRGKWGDLSIAGQPARGEAKPEGEAFDWEGDHGPGIPYSQSFIYRLHPRGFTKHPSSGVEARLRGSFEGIVQKLPYLKDLGVTAIELMPASEFDEVMLPKGGWDGAGEGAGGQEKINYWGYGPSRLRAPKAAYCAGPKKAPVRQFKEFVKAVHQAGMELIAELYFTGAESPADALETARRWVYEYHVDGLHLSGAAPLALIGQDPYLSGTKLLAASWEGVNPGKNRHLAECNDGFMMDMRSFLKSDEGQLERLAYRIRRNPEGAAAVNYMANTNGFTLMDMVSYNEKHNEDNGENNRDGSDWNMSWNCGAEGPVRKKQIMRLRRRQLRNAILLLFLSQGTPLLLGGDEFGRTKRGNNNSYCQDNEISWLNWGLLKVNQDLYQFVKRAAAFRKAHPVFHMEKEPALMDYRSLGIPDLSYHGLKAWCPDFEPPLRQLGAFYCGLYGVREDQSPDDYFYVAYNMHWEPREFALPHLPKGLKWHLAANTHDEETGGFLPEGQEQLLENQKQFMLEGRSIAVFMGKPASEPAEPDKKEVLSWEAEDGQEE